MIKVSWYKKDKGQKYYRKNGEESKYSGSIRDWQTINSVRRFRSNPAEYEVKTDYSDFGQTYTRTVKSKKTGNSYKVVVKEF